MKKKYAVIGDPIHQSMSPFMHEHWLKENKLDGSYLPHLIDKESLASGIKNLAAQGYQGWNVTIPHKTAILPFLQEIDDTAQVMQAVNTVEVLANGQLKGSNTDGPGFVRALEEAFGCTGKQQPVLVIGAGGAARGICFSLHEAGYGPITISNRTVDHAKKLASEIPGATSLSLQEAADAFDSFSIVVQTTAVGMRYGIEGMPLTPAQVKAGTIVADIIYNPLETAFLHYVKDRGARTMNGVGMFVHQGALSFEKWTGIRPNTKEMIQKITGKLGGSYVNR